MSFASAMLSTFLGDAEPPAVLWIGLARDGRELDVAGYQRRLVLRGSWDVRGDTASVVSTFGPFEEGASFDGALLIQGNEVLERAPFEAGAVTLPGGMSFEYETVIDLSGRARG